jgi:putative transcriptional regulator
VNYACYMNNKLRELRIASGKSQADLAAAMGVSRQTINRIETFRLDPSLSLAARLARYFGLRIEDIFYLDEL